jgi:hypothetical protein
MIDFDNRDYVTIVECINAVDDNISLFLILKKISIWLNKVLKTI